MFRPQRLNIQMSHNAFYARSIRQSASVEALHFLNYGFQRTELDYVHLVWREWLKFNSSIDVYILRHLFVFASAFLGVR